MLRTYKPIPFDHWVCENQPGDDAQYRTGWWDTIEFVRFLANEFGIMDITIIGDFDAETPPPTEILRMPVFLLRFNSVDVCLKNDFSPLEPYWSASVVIGDKREFACYGLNAPLNRWKHNSLTLFPETWRFSPYISGSRRFSCGLAHEHAVFTLFWLLTHTPSSEYSDHFSDLATQSDFNESNPCRRE